MSDFDNLEKYKLLLHGDPKERTWWPLLSNDFSEYEIFWRRYVVPLTNRIDPAVPEGDEQKIRFRALHSEYEKMAMTHYSVFYFLARATQKLNSERLEFPEDTLFLLDSCLDNAQAFFKAILVVVADLGGSLHLPTQSPAKSSDLGAIRAYRDVLLHNPVIGRVMQPDGEEFLPRLETLDEVKESWKKAFRLSPEQLVSSKVLLSDLRRVLIAYLRQNWAQIIEVLDQLREGGKFRKALKLDGLLPVGSPDLLVRGRMPPMASPVISPTVISVTSNTNQVSVSWPPPPEKGNK
jgi:hypothetical protein